MYYYHKSCSYCCLWFHTMSLAMLTYMETSLGAGGIEPQTRSGPDALDTVFEITQQVKLLFCIIIVFLFYMCPVTGEWIRTQSCLMYSDYYIFKIPEISYSIHACIAPERGILIRVQPIISLQILCEFMINFHIISKYFQVWPPLTCQGALQAGMDC